MQYNIFNNDFYEDMPGVPWAYRIDVFIGDPPQAITKLAKAVKEIDIPDAELETMDAFHAGFVFKIPTRYKNSNSFGAIFNDDKNLSVYKELLKLFRRSYDNREQTIQSAIQTGTYSGREIARKYANQKEELMLNVYIIDPRKLNYKDTKLDVGLNNVNEEVINGLKANDPEIVAVYTFRDCFVENIETVEFDYSSEECVEWPIKIHFNEMSVDYPHQDKIIIPDEDFKMEELTIPQFDKSDATYYTPKETNAKTESDVVEEQAKSDSAEYARAKQELEKIKTEMKDRRESAETEARKHADSEGRIEGTNDYVTAAERHEANRKKAEEVQEQETQAMLDKHEYYEIRDKYGVDLVNDSEEEIRAKVSAMQTEDLINMNYNHTTLEWSNFADELVARKQTINQEAKDIAKSIDTRFDITTRDEGAVDMNDTESTNQWYAKDKQGAAYMDQKAAEIKQLQSAINAQEVDKAQAVDRQAKKRKQYVESKTIGQQEFMDNLEVNTKAMNDADNATVDSMRKFDEIKKNYKRADIQEEPAKPLK
jgi:hypothetical protein